MLRTYPQAPPIKTGYDTNGCTMYTEPAIGSLSKTTHNQAVYEGSHYSFTTGFKMGTHRSPHQYTW
jgi:hypothetical protein